MSPTGTFLVALVLILDAAIIARALMSLVSPGGHDPISRVLYQITELIYMPIRRVMPKRGLFDITPVLAFVLLTWIILPIVFRLV